ncbi:MAG: hypothetical protein QGG40_16775, partial [Myxococcota bacterium]|nr:hypothetical protein [Myxococcota bacterium]
MRVLVVGCGPLPGPGVSQTHMSQLRTAVFLRVLREAGHEVRGVLLGGGTPDEERDLHVASMEGESDRDRLVELARDREVLVSVGAYAPGRVVVHLAEDRPCWIDIPGDPMAELRAVAEQGPVAMTRVSAALEAYLPVLQRADAMGVVGVPQRHALMGQLGLVGRLHGRAPPIHITPVPYEFPGQQRSARTRSVNEPLAVLLAGGFNAWLDDRAMTAALEASLSSLEQLEVHCTGGAIPGHFEAGYARFLEWAGSTRFGDRIHVHGWLPERELGDVVESCHVGLFLDRPGWEPTLGSRTRLMWFVHQGLEPIHNSDCALARELASEALVPVLPDAFPGTIERALVHRVASEGAGPAIGRAQSWLARRFSPESVVAPLLEWLHSPDRADAL